MAIPFYLAQTGAEFHCCQPRPDKIGWMACHFSSYGTGVSNLPPQLPEGSLLILNDRTPVRGHDPQRIFEQLSETIRRHRCSGLLMDFQRAGEAGAASIAAALAALPCPVAVSALYAAGLDCAVFLPPTPLLTPVADHLQPWQGREIWLDIGTECLQITITESGSAQAEIPLPQAPCGALQDDTLHCHYNIQLDPEQAIFTLQRNRDDLLALLEEAASLGATQAIGLYQDFRQW